MFKLSILLNSSTTFLILIINFSFKIYLAREFPKDSLIIYYTITDIFSLIGRFFIGYKDSLTTLYNQTNYKLKVMRLFTIFLMWVIIIVSFIMLPIISYYYLPEKIENFNFNWIYISLLFISINMVSFYGYIFLVTKHYKLISIKDIIQTILWISFIIVLHILLNFDPNYKTLIYATILSNIFILLFLIYKQKKYLPQYSLSKLIDIKFPKFRDNTIKKFILTTIMASSSYFIYGLLLFAPVYVMINEHNMKELGDYQVVARSLYFALVSVFSWPLGRFMFPEFSSLISKKNYEALDYIHMKFIKLLISFGIIVVLSCWALSKDIIGFIFPLEYIDSYKIINILIIALPFVMYQNFSESIIKAVGNYKINLIIKFSGIVFFIISYLILNFLNIDLASIYAFVLGMLGIFLLSLYFEFKIKKSWSIL